MIRKIFGKCMKILAVIPLVAIMLTMQSYSQKTYTLDKAIEEALQNNHQTKMALRSIDSAKSIVKEAYGYAYPNVDVSATYYHYLLKSKMPFPDFEAMLTNATYSIFAAEGVQTKDGIFDEEMLKQRLRPMGYSLQSFFLSNNFDTKVEFSQILFNSTVFRGIGVSGEFLKVTQTILKSVIADVVRDVKLTFYGVLLAKEYLQISEDALANFEKNLSNVKALHNAGLVSEYDLLQAEVSLENFRPQVHNARNAMKNAKDGLKLLLGKNQAEEIDVTGILEYTDEPIPDVDEMVNQSYKSNLSLDALHKKRHIDEAMIDLHRSEYWPMVTAFGNYSYAGASDDWNFQTYGSSMIGLNLQMNLFKGGRTSQKVEQAQIGVQQTDEQILQFKNYLAAQIKSKKLELEKVKTVLAAQERNVGLAERALQIANTRFREGQGTQLEVLNAQMELRQARTNRLQSVYEYLSAKFQLDNLLGRVNEEYLNYYKN